jgi:hypothetical protein
MSDEKKVRIQQLIGELYKLSDSQLEWVEAIIHQFSIPRQYML